VKKRLHVLFILILFALSCKTAEFGFRVFDVNGMIYDFSNRPVANCEISLGGRRFMSTSDINGRFTIPRVPLGNYTLTVNKDGYERYSEDFPIMQKGQIIYVRLPSQNQLLDMVDEALTANNFLLAEEMAERAYLIDPNNVEMLFYFAAVKYKQRDYNGALGYLASARDLASTHSMAANDPYIDKFIALLMRKINAN